MHVNDKKYDQINSNKVEYRMALSMFFFPCRHILHSIKSLDHGMKEEPKQLHWTGDMLFMLGSVQKHSLWGRHTQ